MNSFDEEEAGKLWGKGDEGVVGGPVRGLERTGRRGRQEIRARWSEAKEVAYLTSNRVPAAQTPFPGMKGTNFLQTGALLLKPLSLTVGGLVLSSLRCGFLFCFGSPFLAEG